MGDMFQNPVSGDLHAPRRTAPADALLPPNAAEPEHEESDGNLLDWVRGMVGKNKSEPTTLRDTLEEIIAGDEEKGERSHSPSSAAHQGALLSNVVKLRDLTVVDVMIPRVDIVAIAINTSQQDLLSLLSEKQFSRLPVYRESLDDVVGSIHIKDILACLARGEDIVVENLVRNVPIVSPSMPVLDLILMMKQMRKHMALVVDEYGGIDGLVTIGDVIEVIMGEVDDEHAVGGEQEPQLVENPDGTLIADARFDIEAFEKRYGNILRDEEREDIDTLGGLIYALAGRIPARGEVLTHSSGMIFEILDADPRKVRRVLIRNVPRKAEGA
jgi:CBS domain containing-hemolysin-like protein